MRYSQRKKKEARSTEMRPLGLLLVAFMSRRVKPRMLGTARRGSDRFGCGDYEVSTIHFATSVSAADRR
jgi:hypothetical protein